MFWHAVPFRSSRICWACKKGRKDGIPGRTVNTGAADWSRSTKAWKALRDSVQSPSKLQELYWDGATRAGVEAARPLPCLVRLCPLDICVSTDSTTKVPWKVQIRLCTTLIELIEWGLWLSHKMITCTYNFGEFWVVPCPAPSKQEVRRGLGMRLGFEGIISLQKLSNMA